MSSPAVARLGRFSIKALRIGASTAAILELLRQHWISAAWLLAIQPQKRVPQAKDAPDSP